MGDNSNSWIRITRMQIFVAGRAVEPETALEHYGARYGTRFASYLQAISTVGQEYSSVNGLMPLSGKIRDGVYRMPRSDSEMTVRNEDNTLRIKVDNGKKKGLSGLLGMHDITNVAELSYEPVQIRG